MEISGAAHHAAAQIVTESFRVLAGALARPVRDDRLGRVGQRNEGILVADQIAVFRLRFALLLADERPDFVQLDPVDVQIAHHGAVQLGAPFREGGDNGDLLVERQIVHGANPWTAGWP